LIGAVAVALGFLHHTTAHRTEDYQNAEQKKIASYAIDDWVLSTSGIKKMPKKPQKYPQAALRSPPQP
jgi:hypothetical protein